MMTSPAAHETLEDADGPIAGFISPPRWYDPSPREFASICAGPIRTQQTILPMANFAFELPNIARTEPEMMAAARSLGESGCQAIAKTGTPFAWAGAETESAARGRALRLADSARVPVVMAGLAIVDALRALGLSRVAVCTPYYTEEWRACWGNFLRSCDVDVLTMQSMDQQGILPADVDIADHSWATSPQMVMRSAEAIMQGAPTAQAVIITGAGARTLALTRPLEAQLGVPVIASDTALYWALAAALRVKLVNGALGALTDAPGAE